MDIIELGEDQRDEPRTRPRHSLEPNDVSSTVLLHAQLERGLVFAFSGG